MPEKLLFANVAAEVRFPTEALLPAPPPPPASTAFVLTIKLQLVPEYKIYGGRPRKRLLKANSFASFLNE
jgi:hypothetical protein